MTASIPTAPLTLDDLDRLPDGARAELVEGEVRPKPAPDWDHADIVGLLVQRLRDAAERHAPGVVGPEGRVRVRRNPDTVYLPDAAYIRAERAGRKGERRGLVDIAPDLVVEVISPDNSAPEMHRKVRDYLAAGCRLVWIVDPATRTVDVHWPDRTARTFIEGETLDGGDVLPGFALPVAEIFA